MRIFGIDPGSLRTGFGIIDAEGRDLKVVAYGVVAPPAGTVLGDRLIYIAAQLAELSQLHAPDVVAIENIFAGRSPRSALVLGQARGAAIVGVGTVGAPLVEVAPTRIKSLVAGHGRASKAEVTRGVRALLKIEDKLQADASDALAIALSVVFHMPGPGATEPRLRVRRVPARQAWAEELKRRARQQRKTK
jgi:crossover junction endodeoxyribonuclease RuvC